MTVSYSLKVSRAGMFSFPRLLFMWRGSVYKLIYAELIIYLLVYGALSCIYRFALNDVWATRFELTCVFFRDGLLSVIPLSFLLGFYVSLVIGRWWDMYTAIPNMDEISQLVATYIRGNDDETRMQRRTIIRWLTLSSTIVFSSVAPPVLKRFPTTQHLVKAGLMTDEERKMYESMQTPHVKWWLPVSWCCNMIARLKIEGKLGGEAGTLIVRIQDHRKSCALMMDYDWTGVPLVYTQVVTIATYLYFIAKLFSSQFLNPDKGYADYTVDIYFPVILVCEFIFYFGWLKVAIVLINPYGGDDDDFEINYILDRSYQVGLLIVDDGYDQLPQLHKDIYWCKPEFSLPASRETDSDNQGKAWLGSTVPVGFQLGAKKAALAVAWAGKKRAMRRRANSATVATANTTANANTPEGDTNKDVTPDHADKVADEGAETWAAKREESRVSGRDDDDIPMETLPDEHPVVIEEDDNEPKRYRPDVVKITPAANKSVMLPCGVPMEINEGFEDDQDLLDDQIM